MSTPSKILVVGTVNGSLEVFVEKISKFNKKGGPFDFVLVSGDFPLDDQSIQTLKNKIPVSTLIISGNKNLPSSLEKKVDPIKGGEICDNLFYLGKSGIYVTSEGIKIAFLSGLPPPPNDSSDSKDNEQTETSCHFSIEDVDRLVEFSKKLTPSINYSDEEDYVPLIDILVTFPWPSHVQKHSAISTPSAPKNDSLILSDLCYKLKPRYYFASEENLFFEREPFSYKPHIKLGESTFHKDKTAKPLVHYTRFIGLGEFGSKTRWFYAMNMTPLHIINSQPKDLGTIPQNITECPFKLTSLKRKADDVNSMIFAEEKKSKSKVPPPNYVCKICNITGHFISDCPEKNNKEPIKKSIDDIKNECWFCLSNPDIQKHLIADIGENLYLVLPKGGLNCPRRPEFLLSSDSGNTSNGSGTVSSKFMVPGGGHVLVVPIDHITCPFDNVSISEDFKSGDQQSDLQPIVEEYHKYKDKITKLFDKYDCVPISIQFVRKNNFQHSFIPLIAFPKKLLPTLRDNFIQAGKKENIVWSNSLPSSESFGYYKCEIPDGKPPLIYHLDAKKRVDIQIGRKILAQALEIENGGDWKSCTLSHAEEKALKKSLASELRKI
ncbi:hypothetical protein BB560_001256 [Smittium megazygosporum]|uniref:CCHC-type domain-containing protein n=1 Tax=Smittium megazygosporum TaxID=133381 RepID=A0A2T9ZI47_9FUNG|nr:hypothetical protein BB560_003494 [Smittium megazygosporum]PVV04240.1 hypothetical protein BB560_001256 [Smittium megazygosporum]